ncbi:MULTISPECIES: BamA/TamA family outer membrane protein [Niastella]|uniref:Bacterial surface antigen (D15) domain-containing protein n=1 Tax=Niastella soli TaxID=2821487 RepID=A0ABS3Z0Y2_9BACT|nr:hypothetical protein [Niastella soli]MBO9203807.1 hypothetical protein [Niastella soli]
MERFFKNISASILIVVAGVLPDSGFGQGQPKAGTVKVPANADYDKAGHLKRVMLGEHYRKEWACAIDFPVLNLDVEAGGLTAEKLGGGHQTKSLRLKGADGKEFVLRSVNKDPSKALPIELVGTLANTLLQDQISSSNPFAPLVVAQLAESAGIFHTNPRLVYVPASARLGEFEKDFANTICLFEEIPSGDKADPNFGYSAKIVNSERLFKILTADPDHRVDQFAFLKARLFDMWIGDWDRHEDQWLWAAFKNDGLTFYKPIPRDRDQAFAKLDGVIPTIATRKWAVRQSQHFDYTVRDLNGLNMSGYYLDKNFTNQLTLNEWLETAADLQKRLTDEAIESAVKAMPGKIFTISGPSIISKLKKRRDDLKRYATQYYKFLAEEVYVTGTEEKEIFEVRRLNSDSTLVTVYKQKENGAQEIIFERVFLREETHELRLYGLGGNDEFRLNGDVRKGTLVRIIGGRGSDHVVDSSSVNGWSRKTKIYDNEIDNDNTFKKSKESRQYISDDTLKNDFQRGAFRYDWLGLKLSPGYNPDDGVYLGGGIIFKKQKFGKAPYGSMQSIWGNYAVATGAYNFWYQGIFKEAVGKWDLNVDAKLNAPNYIRNYYGMGNETENVADRSFYRVRSNDLAIMPSLQKQFGKHHSIEFGTGYQSIKLKEDASRLVSRLYAKLDSTDFERKYYGIVHVGYQFSTLDAGYYHRKGISIKAGAKYTRNIEDSKDFMQLYSESTVFFSTGAWTAALRGGVATNIGNNYAFYQANTVGGSSNLRGYRRDRFSGKTSVFNNTEVRYKIGNYNGYIFRGEFGLLTFFDNGRVWTPDEKSTTWHCGYGGGFWALVYNRLPMTVTYGTSKENNLLTVKAGFLF